MYDTKKYVPGLGSQFKIAEDEIVEELLDRIKALEDRVKALETPSK